MKKTKTKDEKPLLQSFSFDQIMKGIIKVRPPPKQKEIKNKKKNKKRGKD